MSVFLPQWWQICVPYFLCLFVIKKNINWFQIVTGEAPLRLTSQSLSVSWFYCGQWFCSMSSLSCTTLAPTRLWVRYLWWITSDRGFFDLVLLCFFSFMFIGVCFCFVSWRWRWMVDLFELWDLVWKSWIWFSGLKIWVL